MTPERHQRAKDLFLSACALASEERETFLARACDGDAALRDLVDALLVYYRGPSGVDGTRIEAAARLAEGQLVDGKYAVEARIGAGGMGEVYRARQLALDRSVVLKVLLSDLPPDARLRFEREARALARLNHPHVVAVHDLGVSDDVGHYLVMEYVDGRTLRDEARRRRTLPVDEAVRLVRQVCEGASAAHAAGVIHRDLKPENVLLEGEGEHATAKVADFGIARLVESAEANDDSLTGRGAVIGTALYMSPEQCRGEEADARSDVYALGCVLYELLTGRPPFTADSVLALLEKHRTEPPMSLTDVRPDVPPSLARTVARALEKKPERRWQSASELGEALASEMRESGETESLAASDALAAGSLVADTPSNLPRPLTRCIGREREMGDLATRLADDSVRLVTITGTGGIGKTRLAVEVAHTLAPRFADGVFQVELAPLSDPSLVAQQIAQVFGVKESASGSVADRLVSFLEAKRLLLLLDNFEHLLSGAPLLARLLEAAPRVKALVTSQAPLRVRGEHEYALAALEVPAAGIPLEELERSPAVALFVERARASKPSFALTVENGSAVAEICRRLEGLPLAIELSAARMKLLGPEAVLARLERQLVLLVGGARDLPERQRTMRAAVTWSYELLGDEEKALLRRLAVFAGGCTLEAAEAVCGDGVDVLDALGSLVDKSLVRRHEGEPERFGMLEVVREFALERLEADGEAEAARLGHARYFAGLAHGLDPSSSPDDASDIAIFRREHENLRTALAVLLEREPREGVAMTLQFRRYWLFRNLFSEGIGWMKRALATGGAGRAERATLLTGESVLEGFLGDREAAGEHVTEAVAIARTLDDKSVLFYALNAGGLDLLQQPGMHAGARTYLEEALAVARSIEHQNWSASALVNLAAVAELEGNRDLVRAYTEEALGLTSKRVVRISCLLNLGDLALDDGDLDDATERLRAALVESRLLHDRGRAAFALESLSEIALKQGAAERAARLAAAVEALCEPSGGARIYVANESWEDKLARIRAALDPAAFEREWARGLAMDLDEAVDDALRDD